MQGEARTFALRSTFCTSPRPPHHHPPANPGDGAPAKELLTESVYDFTTKITRVLDLEDAEEVDLGTVGTSTVGRESQFHKSNP